MPVCFPAWCLPHGLCKPVLFICIRTGLLYDVLHSPSNLQCWNLADLSQFRLCLREGSLEHILSSCPYVLGEGRYRWQHDQVLKYNAESIASAITEYWTEKTAKQVTRSITTGERPTETSKVALRLLNTEQDWQLMVDLERLLRFLQHIVKTTLRPDTVLVSETTKHTIM